MPQALTTAGSRRHSSPKLDGRDSQDRDKGTPVAAGALCRPDEQKPERYRARTINPTSNFDGHLLKWVAGGGPSERTRPGVWDCVRRRGRAHWYQSKAEKHSEGHRAYVFPMEGG